MIKVSSAVSPMAAASLNDVIEKGIGGLFAVNSPAWMPLYLFNTFLENAYIKRQLIKLEFRGKKRRVLAVERNYCTRSKRVSSPNAAAPLSTSKIMGEG